jgi:6-phosphogluconolactonase
LFVTLADLDEVAAYTVSPLEGGHKLVGKYKSGGVAPVHGSIIADDILLIANYHGPDDVQTSDGASAASMRINDDCSLELADSKPHSGSSLIPWRQGGAHVHSFNAGFNRQAYACDLGMDKIFTYSVASNGTLKEPSNVDVQPGLGPRHAVQTEQHMYVVHEMGQAVTAYHKHADGSLTLNQTLELVHHDRMNNLSKAAEIVGKPGDEHHSGYLYATNRGERNTVSVLGIGDNGAIRELMQVEAPAYPRGMTLAHEGKVLLVAGQSKTEIVSFKVGSQGSLEPTKFRLNASHGLPPHPAAFAVFDASTQELTV